MLGDSTKELRIERWFRFYNLAKKLEYAILSDHITSLTRQRDELKKNPPSDILTSPFNHFSPEDRLN